ncbi:single-stranded DNA-binding protein [Nakamurella lactea]|uniref:single-stranded DNA-binding protein n=1 Tax=Nakamurella lactea TaxID=459515 RepID=UPI00041C2D7B|nr:single-stranded DNA-binding protein [Nakamurella lactea]
MALPYITIQGNIVRDPELRFTASGKAVASITVAANERYKDKAGEWQDGSSLFLDASIWGPEGEEVANLLHRGSKVTVTGKLHTRSWETKDGTKASKVELKDATVAEVIQAPKDSAGGQRPADPWEQVPAAVPGDDSPPF